MISEKEMMIVDAVNYLEAKNADPLHSTVWLSSRPYYFAFGRLVSDDTVCSVDIYNQCIREMSVGAFVPNAKPEFAHGQRVYVDDSHFLNKEIKFGCLSLDGNNAILLTEDSYASWLLAGISSKPIKTKEEIELEGAELAQLNRILKKHSGKFLHPNQFKRAINEMQKDGDLAELLLPLESK